MKFELVEDWCAILRKAWSVKFSILSALLGGLEVAVAVIQPAGIPNGVFAGLAGATTTAAIVARVLAQREMTNGPTK